MSKEKKAETVRDEYVRQLGDQAMLQAMLIPPIQQVRKSIETFSEDTQKYSRRMEKLTIAMLILAIAQFSLAAVTIALIAQ